MCNLKSNYDKSVREAVEALKDGEKAVLWNLDQVKAVQKLIPDAAMTTKTDVRSGMVWFELRRKRL